MKARVTKKGQPTILFRARYWCEQNGDLVRDYRAVNEHQAQKIAQGMANKNQWIIRSVGKL